jgi:TPP-dependent indolepyruvate ferredoxin oxidoreductase alpha subunit
MNAIEEAKRYLENAKEILSTKAKKEDGYYQDKKYVKMAGHTAYTGVLVALDAFLNKKKGRKSIEWYKEELSKADKKVLNQFRYRLSNAAFDDGL